MPIIVLWMVVFAVLAVAGGIGWLATDFEDEPVRERDAELVARVEARVAKYKLREEARVAEDEPVEVRTSAIPPMDPEETAEAVRAVYLPRELCEERSCIEAFVRDGGLTEREEALADLWLRWDDVAQGIPWPGIQYVRYTPEHAVEMRGRVYQTLAASYSRAAGEPGSKVRSGAQDPRRHNEEQGGLVLSKESVRERAEELDEVVPGCSLGDSLRPALP